MTETPCSKCERLLHLYLDGELEETEAREAEVHLNACGYCRRQYRFERVFREYLRHALAGEPMSTELKVKLGALRTTAHPADRA